MRIKIRGGTARHDGTPLCHTCRHACIVRGRRLRDEVVECGRLSSPRGCAPSSGVGESPPICPNRFRSIGSARVSTVAPAARVDMPNRRSVARLSLVGAAAVVLAAASASGQQRVEIQRVAWLQGCWESVSGPRTIEEHWMAPRGNSMIGMGRTVRDGRLAEFELVVLREEGDGLAYDARPSGQAPTVFLSTTVSDSTVVFENPEHDFPQRVGYQRKNPGLLLAWIEGTDRGQTRRIDFRYRRTACPGSK